MDNTLNRTIVLEKQERETIYDWLRLIATIFVVIGHSAYLNIQTTYGGVAYELPAAIDKVYNAGFLSWCRFMASWVYGFHMPLFFMLSGAVLALRPLKSFDSIVRGKVKRLLIPYFVYGWLFMLPVKRLGNFYTNESLISALKGFLSGQDSGHLWFLIALFWRILVFCACKKLFEKIGINSIYLLLFLCGAIQLLYGYLPFDILGLKTGLSYIFYFSIGYVFEVERHKNDKWNIYKILFAILILLFIEVINNKYWMLNGFFVIMIGSFLTYLLANLCNRLFHVSDKKLWNFVIRNLFYVYLLHDPLNYIVLRIFIGNDYLTSALGCYLYTFFRTVFIFLITLLAGECIGIIKKKGNLLINNIRVKDKLK